MDRAYSSGMIFLWRDDGYVIEATWKDDEITGYGKLSFTKKEFPKSLDPKENSTLVLSYAGYLRDCRMDGEGTLVT